MLKEGRICAFSVPVEMVLWRANVLYTTLGHCLTSRILKGPTTSVRMARILHITETAATGVKPIRTSVQNQKKQKQQQPKLIVKILYVGYFFSY